MPLMLCSLFSAICIYTHPISVTITASYSLTFKCAANGESSHLSHLHAACCSDTEIHLHGANIIFINILRNKHGAGGPLTHHACFAKIHFHLSVFFVNAVSMHIAFLYRISISFFYIISSLTSILSTSEIMLILFV